MSHALFESLKCLLPPKTSSDLSDPSLTLASCVDNYLRMSASQNSDHLKNEMLAGTEVHEAFCACCMHHLQGYVELDQCLVEDILLSVSHFDQLKSCLEFLVCLGVYPYLDPGVSVPLELRMDASSCFNLPPRNSSSKETRESKLLKFSKCLLQLRQCRAEQLKRLASSSMFLGDLIAALMQVGYGSKNASEESRESRQLLWKLLCDLPGFVAMKELLILQGGSTSVKKVKGAVKLPPAPIWLRKTCGRLLSRLLIRSTTSSDSPSHAPSESGVRNLLLASTSLAPGLVSSPTGCINSLDPRLQPALAQALARILASKPSWLAMSAQTSADDIDKSRTDTVIVRYFESIARQVLDLINLKFTVAKDDTCTSTTVSESMTESVARFGGLVGVTTVHELCMRDATLGRRLFLQPLLSVLYRGVVLDEDNTPVCSVTPDNITIPDTSDECELASVQQLNRLIDHVYSLLTCPSPSSVVSTELIRLSAPLFLLLMQINLECAIQATDDEGSVNASSRNSGEPTITIAQSKAAIASLLSQLLTIGLDTRASRVSVLRTWLHLKPNSVNVESCTLPLPINPRFRFRHPQPIRALEDSGDQYNTMDIPDSSTYCRAPYRCVLTREPMNRWLDHHPDALFSLIESAVDVLNSVAPPSDKTIGDGEESIPVPSIDIMFRGPQDQEPDTRASASAACLPSDLFISFIADINENLSRFLNPSNPTNIIITSSESASEAADQAALISSSLAATMLQRMGDRIWPQDPDQLVQLFEMTLDRLGLLIGQVDDDEARTFLGETLSQLLGILAFYANQIGPSSSCATSVTRDQFGRLVPVLARLQRICEQHSTVLNASQRELLHCLHVLVATRGAVHLNPTTSPEVSDVSSTVTQQDTSTFLEYLNSKPQATLCPLIEELSPPSPDPVSSTAGAPVDPALAEALEQLTDTLIPVRGHALIVLSRLLEARDPCVRGHEERIFKELVHQLTDPDSYVYLNAIRGLAAMGLMLTDRVLHTLLAQFCQPSNPIPAGDSRIELQLKLGEAIMRVLRDLGQMAPKYRNPVLNAMTMGSRATEPLIRAASLSNLSELCRLLQHAIAPVIYELFALIELHLTQDPAPCVRQAAANLARALLLPNTQLDRGLPLWLPPAVLRDLNRLLASRVRVERDPSVCEQIEAALGQLDQCVRGSLFRGPDTPQSLIKEIRVLRPFED